MDMLDIEVNNLDLLTRDDLIQICEDAVVPFTSWSNRDSYSAQVNLQEIYAFLKIGAEYDLSIENEHTIWVTFKNVTKEEIEHCWENYLNIDSRDEYFEEYGYDSEMFDSSGLNINKNLYKTYFNDLDENDPKNFQDIYTGHIGGYLPTRERLNKSRGDDWY